jgi:diguanylate cyclase (GGDEF)-like protein/PAS domain S-box-containing protein
MNAFAHGPERTTSTRILCGVLIALSVTILGAYWVNRAASSKSLEDSLLLDLERRATALTAAVSEQTRGALYTVDLALLHLAHKYAETGVLTELDVETVRTASPSGLVRRVTVIDRAGRVVVTHPAGGVGIDLSDRPHFTAHRAPAEAGAGLYIGRPIKSRIEDEWVIPVSRRLVDRKGAFSGVIAVMVRPEYFSAIYLRVAVDRDDVIAMVRKDGAFLSRSANLYDHLGKDVRADRPFMGSGPEAGTFRSISTHEPVDRVFAYRRLNEWPLATVVGLGVAEPMARLRTGLEKEFRAALAVSALVALLVTGICLVVLRLERSLLRVSQSDRRRAMAFAGASELAWEWDVAARRVRFFGDCLPFFGTPGDEREVDFADWLPAIHPEDHDAVRTITRGFIEGSAPGFECHYRLRFADGGYRWVMVRGQTLERNASGRVSLALGILMDVDAERKAEIVAAQTREAYQRLIESAAEGIFVVDRDGRIRLFNPAAERLLGWHAAEVIGRDAHTLFHCSDSFDESNSRDECPLLMTVQDGLARRGQRMNYRHMDGRPVPLEISVAAISLDGQPDGAVALISDVSRQLAYESELQRLARTDGLTSLWNRRYFVELLERELMRADRDGSPLSLLMLDIDYFKHINDQYGHAAGDAVLVALAAHFQVQLRQVDVIGRLGGEEFGIGLPGIAIEEAMGVAERLRGTIAAMHVLVGEHHVHFTVSIGVASWHRAESFDALLARADTALYDAKDSGRNRVVVRPLPQPPAKALPESAG